MQKIRAQKEGEKVQARKEWISLVNVVSCIAVVILHTNGCFWTYSKERYWFTANIIESLFYFAVPCFFMITGATLMDYRERYSLKVYFVKRIRKTVIPFIAWSLIGLAYKLILGEIGLADINIKYIWNGIVNTSIIPLYWFFPILFGLYLSIPVFAAVKKEYRKEVFSYAVIASFFGGGLMPLLTNTVLKDYAWNLNISAVQGCLLYVLAGYLIYSCDMASRTRVAI